MPQSSSTGPSRNARSSSVSDGAGCFISTFQSGRPENSSASHQVVPDSSASRSVSDMAGSTLRNQPNKRSVNSARRSGGSAATISGSAISAATTLIAECAPNATQVATAAVVSSAASQAGAA